MALPLQEEIRRPDLFQRASGTVITALAFSLIAYRMRGLAGLAGPGFGLWLVATACESWFTLVWLISINSKWTSVDRKTHPQRLLTRLGSNSEFPAIDAFVTTTDPFMEPPVITINTVLSILAVDYPVGKLACYVSDDGCSPITFYSLVEAAKFAKIWVPFCKKFGLEIRAPFMYFAQEPKDIHEHPSGFLDEFRTMKDEYEALIRKILMAVQNPFHLDGQPYLSEFVGLERGNHPSIIKVIHEHEGGIDEDDGIPHLIYVSREKRPRHPHHYKAGAMNVLTRVSGVMTNAPFMLNVDCDMFVNNPNVVHHALCLLLGFDSESSSGFVQFPQNFYDGLKDDPYGNQLKVLFQVVGHGVESIQGQIYSGTNCFHRRKVIYGLPPPQFRASHHLCLATEHGSKDEGKADEMAAILGHSKPFIESAIRTLSAENLSYTYRSPEGLEATLQAAIEAAGCGYESSTSWGSQIGWLYGSTVEDVLTGLKIQALGWKTVGCWPEPPAFRGSAPSSGPDSLVQQKRWSTGLLEILINRRGPVYAFLTGKLEFRQCLAYLNLCIWSLRSVPEFCYSLLPALCIFTGNSIFPKIYEAQCRLLVGIFILSNLYSLTEYRICRLSVREWWNNQRMSRIITATAWLFGLFSVIMKVLGISETVFIVTQKDAKKDTSRKEDEGKFTFDSSPIFIPATALLLVNLGALAVGMLSMIVRGNMTHAGELLCSAWVVLSFLPFLKGLFRSGQYGLPWPTLFKSGGLAFFFLCFCKWLSY